MTARRAVLGFIIVFALISNGGWAQEEAPANVQVTVDGDPVTFTGPILMLDMQFPLLPAEQFLGALGATVNWSAAAQQLNIQLGETQMQMWVGRDWVTVNGARQDMPFALQTFNTTPYVRGPATAELLGLDVGWDPAALTLAVSHPSTMPEGPMVATTLLETREGPPASLLVRVNETGQVGEVPLSANPVIQRGAVGEAPMRARLADLQAGDLVEIVFDGTNTAIGLRAGYAQTIGTIASIQGNQLTLQGGQSHPLGEGIVAYGSDGAPLHLLAAVGQGAILTLNPGDNSVWHILAQRRGTTVPPATGAPVIAAFALPGYGAPLGEGDSLEIRIIGSAAATATVTLGTTGQVVTIPEEDPGVYTGAMTVPAGMLVPDEHLVAQLQAGGAGSQEVQSPGAVMIDSQPPVLELPVPGDQATIADVNTHVRMKFNDGQGVGVDPKTATLSLDGADVTAGARLDPDQIFYDTPGPLAFGVHSATAQVADQLGNVATRTWTFTIEAPDRGILALEHDAAAPLNAGDTLTVTMQVAAPGQAASFAIDGVAEGVAMARVGETNTYQGTYTIRQDDAAAQATVSARFTAADGTQYEATAPTQLTIAAPEVPFAVTTPSADAPAPRRITPAGTAPPGSTVRWTISYQEFILAGDVATGTVRADAAGNWRAEQEVDLRLLLIGMADRYTLSAELLDAAGAVQQTEVVGFKARG